MALGDLSRLEEVKVVDAQLLIFGKFYILFDSEAIEAAILIELNLALFLLQRVLDIDRLKLSLALDN